MRHLLQPPVSVRISSQTLCLADPRCDQTEFGFQASPESGARESKLSGWKPKQLKPQAECSHDKEWQALWLQVSALVQAEAWRLRTQSTSPTPWPADPPTKGRDTKPSSLSTTLPYCRYDPCAFATSGKSSAQISLNAFSISR